MPKFVIEIKEGSDVDGQEIHANFVKELLYHGAKAVGLPNPAVWASEPVEIPSYDPGSDRMTFEQRERLWQMCGNYNVPFREDDYTRPNHVYGGIVEGWIGGHEHSVPNQRRVAEEFRKATIYVGVEKDGRSHT